MEWAIYLTFLVHYTPKHVLTATVLTESGMPKNEYPLLYATLFEHNIKICLLLSIVIVIWFCLNLKRGSVRY